VRLTAFPVGELQMLFATEEIAAGRNRFAGWQVHAANAASNHVFAML
jgi:hypothetical protein